MTRRLPGAIRPGGGAHTGAHAALGRGRRDVASLPQRAGAGFAGLPEAQGGVAQRSARPASRMRPSLGLKSSWDMNRPSIS